MNPSGKSPKPVELEVLQTKGFRVLLSNDGNHPKSHPVLADKTHTCDWVGRIGLPQVPSAVPSDPPEHSWVIERLLDWATSDRQLDALDKLVDSSQKHLVGVVPDATSLAEAGFQRTLLGTTLVKGPDWVSGVCRRLVDETFPLDRYEFELTDLCEFRFSKGLGVVSVRFPIRVLACIFAVGVACEEANRGDRWFLENKRSSRHAYPRKGGGLMPVAYYTVRRRTPANEKQTKSMFSDFPS